MIASLLVLLAANAATPVAAAVVAVDVDEPNPKSMSRSEIRSFNAKLNPTHPYYIRCVKSADIGSLVKRNYSCRTNEQWQKAEAIGNNNARETVEAMQSRGTNNN